MPASGGRGISFDEHTPSKRPHHPTLLHYEQLDFYEGMLVPMEEEGEEEL
jgi:hypothetical protein